jgi:hypothetical protein
MKKIRLRAKYVPWIIIPLMGLILLIGISGDKIVRLALISFLICSMIFGRQLFEMTD